MGAKDEILCPNFESRLEKQNYALNFRKTQLSNITVETNFTESIVRDVHLITLQPVVLCRQIPIWFWVLFWFFFFIKIEIKSKYLVMTKKVSTGDQAPSFKVQIRADHKSFKVARHLNARILDTFLRQAGIETSNNASFSVMGSLTCRFFDNRL